MAEPEENTQEDLDQDLYEHFRLEVDKGQAPLRIDKFLMSRLENKTRNKIQNAAIAGNIRANNNIVKSNYKVKPGDIISIVMAHPPRDREIKGEDIPLDVVYEDDHVVVVNKPAGLVVHPGFGNYSGTLVNALVHHFKNLPSLNEDEPRPGLVHRLDKNTTGLMVIAKNEIAMSKLAKQFFDRTIERTYVALVWGDLDEEEGTITGNLGRSLKDRKIMTVFEEEDMGKHAVTHYKLLERFRYVSFVQCKLETGRTHQIRAHMKHIGHPLFNDQTYGGDKVLKGTTFTKYKQFVLNCFSMLPGQALHARSLGFEHPATGEHMQFEADLPAELEGVLDKWRRYVPGKNL